MKMKALDSFYSSETKQVHAGEEFEIESEERVKEFAARGLAIPVPAAPKPAPAPDHPDAKMQPVPLNKMEPAPDNKAGQKTPDHKPHKGAK